MSMYVRCSPGAVVSERTDAGAHFPVSAEVRWSLGVCLSHLYRTVSAKLGIMHQGLLNRGTTGAATSPPSTPSCEPDR